MTDEELIESYVTDSRDGRVNRLKDSEAGRQILAAGPDRRSALTARALELWVGTGSTPSWTRRTPLARIASELLRSTSKDWTVARLVCPVETASRLNRESEEFCGFSHFPFKALMLAVEKAVERESLSSDLQLALKRWKAAVSPRPLTPAEGREYENAHHIGFQEDGDPRAALHALAILGRLDRIRTPLAEKRRLIERLTTLLFEHQTSTSLPERAKAYIRSLLSGTEKSEPTKSPAVRIDTSDAVGAAIARDIAAGGRATNETWAALLQHAKNLQATAPSRKWLDVAAQLASKIAPDNFAACVSDWLNVAGKPARSPVTCGYISDPTLLNDSSVALLKGLAWIIVAAKRADLAPALGNLAEACFKKIANKGPRNVKVANAAVAALVALDDPVAAAQLSRLGVQVKHPSSRATVNKALQTASRRMGVSVDDLAEMSVPAFGLGLEGRLTRSFGDCSAELRVINSRDVEFAWSKAGKPVKSVPAEVKRDHADALKQFQKLGKDIAKMLTAQRIRIERLLMTEREWDCELWRQRYLDQPLLAGISRRLIWHFKLGDRTALGAWLDGKLVDVDDKPLDWLAPETRVRLWHPIGFPVETIAAWREWIQAHEVCQPFKQAHREVYVLTDAERRTNTYSNRFAAHLLGQHQFAALCSQRGWQYALMGGFDFQATPTLELPAWSMAAEFWVEPAGELGASGISLYVTTDQVRFVRAGEPLPLTEVPATVFSEGMRDVDLFVGVASVGNDPAWSDGGPDGRYRDYWQSYSFGTLNATAQTRKEVLQRLVSRLKIAGQCSFADKFLVVNGSLRTYKIHLGSGSILMEPNDQYLCIVPGRSMGAAKAGEKVFLPFEGDSTLSVILSKAFLLAEDEKIKDETIRRQITAK